MGSDASGEGIFSPKVQSILDPGAGIERKFGGGQELIRGKGRDPLSAFGDEDLKKATKEAEAAKKAAKRQGQLEAARVAAAESDIATRRFTGAGRGGRSLLIATSPTGTRAQTLGGA